MTVKCLLCVKILGAEWPMSAWQIIDLKSSTSEAHLRSTSPGKMWWQTQHSADFGNWVSIKALLSQKEMCHAAKSSFYDAVCLVSFGLQYFGSEKEKHRVGRHLNGYLWCKSSHIFGWTSIYSWFFRVQRGGRSRGHFTQSKGKRTASISAVLLHWLCYHAGGRKQNKTKKKTIILFFPINFFF